MVKKNQRIYKNKKHHGAEASIELNYVSHTENANVAKIQIEEWVSKKLTTLLAEFHMEFPGV